jgi:hypothetical protein
LRIVCLVDAIAYSILNAILNTIGNPGERFNPFDSSLIAGKATPSLTNR